MSFTPSTVKTESKPVALDGSLRPGPLIVGGASVVFATLQSICSVVVAVNSARVAIGLGSLAMTVGIGAELERFHSINWLRVSFTIFALLGSIVTLLVVIRARQLRTRPAAQWRARPQTKREKRMEALQIALSVITLLMLMSEEYFHYKLVHTL